MIKNIIIYLIVLLTAIMFNIFYYAWFSWFLLLIVICIPLLSLAVSLPLMIISAVNGFKIFSEKSVSCGSKLSVGIMAGKQRSFLCPLVIMKIKLKNDFAHKNKNIKFMYSGVFNKSVSVDAKTMADNCGCVDISAKYFKVYDFTGIFFIIAKTDCFAQTFVMPQPLKPEKLPQHNEMSVLGYHTKSGGGFSDIYELRQYQNGDSLKNIHWKLSSKRDSLIVKEPTVPIYKEFLIKLCFTQNTADNNSILARFLYVSDFLLKNNILCFAGTGNGGCVVSIKNFDDISSFIKSIYNNTLADRHIIEHTNAISYSIFADCEEVAEL